VTTPLPLAVELAAVVEPDRARRAGLLGQGRAVLVGKPVSGSLASDVGASSRAFEAATGENTDLAALGRDCLGFTGTHGALSFPSLALHASSGPGEVEWRKPLAADDGVVSAEIDPIAGQMRQFVHVAG